jgi:hypothetical protein
MSLLPIQPSERHDVDVFTHIDVLAYAENNSVYHLSKGHEVDYKRAESAFTSNEFAIGTRYKNFALSYIYRYDWFLRFTEDTMEYYGSTVNESLATPNKTYDISLEVNHINTEGLRLAYVNEYNSTQFYVAASYLKARELMEGDLVGDVTLSGSCANDINCYTGDLYLDYTYSEDVLLDRKVAKPSSIYGYSLDFGFDWQITPRLITSLYIKDLISEIKWDNAPFTTANVTTNTTAIRDDRYEVKLASGSGYEGNKDYTQTLPVKYNARVSYQLSNNQHAYLQGFYAYNALLLYTGYQYTYNDTAYGIKLYPMQEAIGLEVNHSVLSFSVTSKPFDYQESELLELMLGINIPFR